MVYRIFSVSVTPEARARGVGQLVRGTMARPDRGRVGPTLPGGPLTHDMGR